MKARVEEFAIRAPPSRVLAMITPTLVARSLPYASKFSIEAGRAYVSMSFKKLFGSHEDEYALFIHNYDLGAKVVLEGKKGVLSIDVALEPLGDGSETKVRLKVSYAGAGEGVVGGKLKDIAASIRSLLENAEKLSSPTRPKEVLEEPTGSLPLDSIVRDPACIARMLLNATLEEVSRIRATASPLDWASAAVKVVNSKLALVDIKLDDGLKARLLLRDGNPVGAYVEGKGKVLTGYAALEALRKTRSFGVMNIWRVDESFIEGTSR